MALSIAAFFCGLIWCSSCVSCLGVRKLCEEKHHLACIMFTVVACSTTGAIWMGLANVASEEAHTYGALGDGCGIILGILILNLFPPWLNKRRAARAVAAERARAAQAATAAAARTIAAAELPIDIVHATAVEMPMAVLVHGGDGAAAAGGRSNTQPPPLVDLVRALRYELGLKGDESLTESVDHACKELGVPLTGAILGKAHACWRVLEGFGSV